MVGLVVSGGILGFLGLYEPFLEWAGAGAGVPLLGFGNTLWKGVKEGIQEEGILGLFKGGFTAAAGGICGALVLQTENERINVQKQQNRQAEKKDSPACLFAILSFLQVRWPLFRSCALQRFPPS